MRSNLWLTGTGRSGTTVLFRCAEAAGMHKDFVDSTFGNFAEYPPLVELNRELIGTLLFGRRDLEGHCNKAAIAPDVRDRLFTEDFPAARDMIRAFLQEVPEVMKCPRWSCILPLWLRYATDEQLPRVLGISVRNVRDASFSWMHAKVKNWMDAPQGYDWKQIVQGYLRNTRDRLDLLQRSVPLAQSRNIAVHWLEHPDMLFQEEPVIDLLRNCGIPEKKARDAFTETVQLDKIHTYRLRRDRCQKALFRAV